MKLSRTFINWYTLLATIGIDFSQLIGTKGPLKHAGQFLTSLLFMSNLTLLFSYSATPIVWSLNPQDFVFHELLLMAGFMSAVTAIVLTVMPADHRNYYLFKNNSKFTRTTRMIVALAMPLILLILLDYLAMVPVH